MKIVSGKGKGKHSAQTGAGINNNTARKAAQNSKAGVSRYEEAKRKGRRNKMSAKKKVVIVFSCIIGVLLLLGASALAVVRWQIEPFYDYFFKPDYDTLSVRPDMIESVNVVDDDDDDESVISDTRRGIRGATRDEVEAVRSLDTFTFLILGIDDYANTDVIMVATFDQIEQTLDIVSIPRDTLVNVSWSTKKANSIMANMQQQYRGEPDSDKRAMQATVEHFGDILGFEVDFWVTLTPQAFVRLIDAVGPIHFNVPANISEYGVSVPAGNQRLNGIQALTVMRARRVYADADLGRVNTQQNFLRVLAATLIANRDRIKITDLADIFINNVRTDIQLNNLVWFGREMLRLDPENITFHTMPGTAENIRGGSYVTIHIEEWLEMVNSSLSPMRDEITVGDVSILSRGPDRRIYVTDGNWQASTSWGN